MAELSVCQKVQTDRQTAFQLYIVDFSACLTLIYRINSTYAKCVGFGIQAHDSWSTATQIHETL